MAKIGYVDHSFHRNTKSSAFLPEILRKHGHSVDVFWDEAWQGRAPVNWSSVQSHDVVIMFQSYCPPAGKRFRQLHPNVIYIPMLDQFAQWRKPPFNLTDFWEPFQGSKVLNFSNAVHCLTRGFGIASYVVRYFPPVAQYPQRLNDGLHGFFWLRRDRELSWEILRRLIGNVRFDSLHIHLAVDPGTPSARLPFDVDIARHNVTTSTWFENKADLETVLARANVFFAPRLEEGIGLSFLEAMARAQCVVAPNNGTMNEYIQSGFNGLLFDPENPQPLDFSTISELGVMAKNCVLKGRAEWERAEEHLLKFILAPSQHFYSEANTRPKVRFLSRLLRFRKKLKA